jgi:hypothetical protein
MVCSIEIRRLGQAISGQPAGGFSWYSGRCKIRTCSEHRAPVLSIECRHVQRGLTDPDRAGAPIAQSYRWSAASLTRARVGGGNLKNIKNLSRQPALSGSKARPGACAPEGRQNGDVPTTPSRAGARWRGQNKKNIRAKPTPYLRMKLTLETSSHLTPPSSGESANLRFLARDPGHSRAQR